MPAVSRMDEEEDLNDLNASFSSLTEASDKPQEDFSDQETDVPSQKSDEPIFGLRQNAGTWTNSINWQERFKGSKPLKRAFMDEHDEKINSVLKSNNKEIFRVPKNGDCIYSAVCHQVRHSNPDLNPEKLRNIVCDHLIEQADYYSLFIVSNSSETFEQKVKSEQRYNGRWNTDIARFGAIGHL